MTQLRKFRDSISNYFDRIEQGVGKRGSTFTDLDAVSHDLDTHRFLFREFKRENEPLAKPQLWVCQDLAELPRCTVWILRRFENGIIAFEQLGANPVQELLTEVQYLDRLRAWWYPAAWAAVTPRNPPELTAADLKQVEVEVLALARKRGR